jgi:acetyl/propionyl-CoA carboxylase alpha subunit
VGGAVARVAQPNGFGLASLMRKLTLEVDGEPQEMEITRVGSAARIVIDGVGHEVDLRAAGPVGLYRLQVDGRTVDVHIRRAGRGLSVAMGAALYEVMVQRGGRPADSSFDEGEQALAAPMSGVVTEVLVSEGERVSRGDPLLVMVAMKMNNEIRSPVDGMVRSLHAMVGEQVEQGALLVVLEPSAAS